MENTDIKPKKSRWLRYLLVTLVAVAVAITLLIIFFPVNSTVEGRIKRALEASGLKVNSLKVENVGNGQTIISNIDMGGEGKPRITIDKITITYDLYKLLNTKLATDTRIEATTEGVKIDSKPYELRADIVKTFISGRIDNLKATVNTDVAITGLPQDVPPLKVDSEIYLDKLLHADVDIRDEKNEYNSQMKLYFPEGDATPYAELKHAQFPWGGGVISADDTVIPLKLEKDVDVKINLREVQLQELLGKVSEGKIEGQGKISGNLPVTYHKDGSITLNNGEMSDSATGNIRVAPELISGDNQQMELVRNTLQNFHYTMLKISVSSDKEERSVINLAIEGRNPDMPEDRPVKLNINLAGDIIPLLQQSILPLNDFRQYLKEIK